MAKPELGLKRTCVACATKFYDLGKVPPVCPKCGTEQPPEQPRPRRPPSAADERLKKRAPVPVAEAETEEAEVEEAEAADDAEDADEIEDADEVLGEDIVVEGADEEP